MAANHLWTSVPGPYRVLVRRGTAALLLVLLGMALPAGPLLDVISVALAFAGIGVAVSATSFAIQLRTARRAALSTQAVVTTFHGARVIDIRDRPDGTRDLDLAWDYLQADLLDEDGRTVGGDWHSLLVIPSRVWTLEGVTGIPDTITQPLGTARRVDYGTVMIDRDLNLQIDWDTVEDCFADLDFPEFRIQINGHLHTD